MTMSITLCHYDECRYAECHYAECCYAECRYAEYCYDECCYDECHYAERRGFTKKVLVKQGILIKVDRSIRLTTLY
jgi:hypothetical protein